MGSIPLPALSVRAPEQPDLMSQVGKLAQLKSLMQGQQLQQQQLQTGSIENQQRQMALDSSKAMMRAYADAGGDLAKTVPLAAKYGAAPADLVKLQQASIESQKAALELLNAKGARAIQEADLVEGAHNTVAKMPPEQRAAGYQQQLMALQHAGVDVSQAPPQYPGDDAFKVIGLGIKGHKQQLEELSKQQEMDLTAAKTTEAQASARKSTMEADNLQKFGGMSPAMAESRYLFIQSRRNQGQPLTPDDAAFAKAYEHNKTLVPTATINLQSGLLSQQAKDMAAQNYAQTGQLPSGMRSPAMSAQVLNAAASQQPGANIAANRATYKADSASLEALTKNRDAVTAFENTAGKNLDLFLNAAKKVVDSGSPWVNLPLRTVSMKGMGSADLVAFNAARQVAINEIAKVTGNPGLSGQLSDSARHEVESFIPQDANLKQIFQVANVLKQDMANRHQSYNEQIQSIRGRMGGGQQAAPKADPLGIR